MSAKWIGSLIIVAAGVLIAQVGTDTPVEPVNAPAAAPASAPATTSSEKATVLKTPREVESYSLGVTTVKNFKQMKLDVDLDLMIQGMKDAMADNKLLLSDAQIQDAMVAFASNARRTQVGARLALAEENKKAGEAFLTANKTKEGVVTLPSGLQYQVLKEGNGKKPTDTDTVEVAYRGTLIDGTEFDSSAKAEQTLTLKLSESKVIAGWREALKLMPVGSRWKLFIPSQLAYGAQGWGRQIGPNATLVFEVELLAVK